MLKKLWVLPVDIRLSAHSNRLQFRPRAYSVIGSVPMLDIFDKPINGWDSVAKRAFDMVFSLLGILVFSPIMIATVIAIKLDSKGPVIFRQKRHGFNNEVIEVYKFRSMYTDQCDPAARNVVVKDDPRVTRVGRFIRRTSIDELPQFFNALLGSLSLVGPRPHAVAAQSHSRLFNEVVDGYFARHRVKPGVTGWAQINGWRGEIDNDEKIRMRTEYDLAYIENWSLWFDLKILLLTPVRLLNTENAY
jgi:exopolysaccharide biosynthesis polyprenyl glycosylphosphotransferase